MDIRIFLQHQLSRELGPYLNGKKPDIKSPSSVCDNEKRASTIIIYVGQYYTSGYKMIEKHNGSFKCRFFAVFYLHGCQNFGFRNST